jgi:transcription elongation factor SPT6
LWLQLISAESQGLMNVDVHLPKSSFDNLRSSLNDGYTSDYENSGAARAWNDIRKDIILEALEDHLGPIGASWLRNYLTEEEEEFVGRTCHDALANVSSFRLVFSFRLLTQDYYQRIDKAPFWNRTCSNFGDTPEVISVSNGAGEFKKDPVFIVRIDKEGRYRNFIKLDDLRTPENRDQFKRFLIDHKSTVGVITVGGYSPAAFKLMSDVKAVAARAADDLKDSESYEDALNEEQRAEKANYPAIFVYDDVARLYQNSKRAEDEFQGFPMTFKYCVALARFAQNPVNEYAALGKDLTAVTYDFQHQKYVSSPFHLFRELVITESSMM